MPLRVAGGQLPVTDDIQANLATVLRAIATAADGGADLLLTPEGSLSGYNATFDAAELRGALTRVEAAARERGLALALGTCYRAEEPGSPCYNQIRFYDEAGAFLGFHAKTLTCGRRLDDGTLTGEVTDYSTTALGTVELNGLTVGGLICNDLWATPPATPQEHDPRLLQRLSEMGANVVLHSVFGGRPTTEMIAANPDGMSESGVYWRYHETNLQLRALSAAVCVVTVDSCFPEDAPCSAPSGVVRPDGTWAYRAREQGEEVFIVDLDDAMLHAGERQQFATSDGLQPNATKATTGHGAARL
jgi:predicted amidohydrolase